MICFCINCASRSCRPSPQGGSVFALVDLNALASALQIKPKSFLDLPFVPFSPRPRLITLWGTWPVPPVPWKGHCQRCSLRALAKFGGFEEIAVLNRAGLTPEELALAESRLILGSSAHRFTTKLVCHGTLLRGQPYLSDLSWLRRGHGFDTAFSLVGLIHTIASPFVRQDIVTHLQPRTLGTCWFALPPLSNLLWSKCSLRKRIISLVLGSTRLPRPQLPLIPLAVDTDRLARDGADLPVHPRARLSVDEKTSLFLGGLFTRRLSRRACFRRCGLRHCQPPLPFRFG